jgi:ribosomal protein L6P/L9E
LHGELMSRIGKKPVDIPAGVKVEVSGQTIKITGPKGTNQRARKLLLKIHRRTAGSKRRFTGQQEL